MMNVENGYVIVDGDYEGCLPVRVLQNNVLEFLLTANDRASSDWEDLIANAQIQREVILDTEHARVYAPSIDPTGRITIQEVFKAALWATSYGTLVLQECWETKCEAGNQTGPLTDADPDVKDAFGLLAYMQRLFCAFEPWPAGLPNPEKYPIAKRDYVEKANNLYVSAAAFCLAHEIGHASLGHLDPYFCDLRLKAHHDPSALTEEEKGDLKQSENQADQFAVEHFIMGLESDTEKAVRLRGIVTTYLCLLIGKGRRALIETLTHPDLPTRIQNVLFAENLDMGLRHNLCGTVVLAFVYFLRGLGVDMLGVVFDDSEDALRHCVRIFDEFHSDVNR
jgi:hypothetical protein